MIELINLHTPALTSLDHPDDFQAQYKVSFELNTGMLHDLAIQTQKRLASGTADPKWCAYLTVDSDSRQIVGFCDFKGPPTKHGTVEIGYSTFLEFQGHGYDSGMVKALIDIAFGESSVTKIIADTLPERNASTRVLEKNGFRLVKEMDDPLHEFNSGKTGEEHATYLSVLRRLVRRSDASSLQATTSDPPPTGRVSLTGSSVLGLAVRLAQTRHADSAVRRCVAVWM
jgi:RimJ/RimL family protein N-acetyltransferase